MKEKTIRIKLRKLPSGIPGRDYKIESITNAVQLDTGGATRRHVGEFITRDEACYLCSDRRTEVNIS